MNEHGGQDDVPMGADNGRDDQEVRVNDRPLPRVHPEHDSGLSPREVLIRKPLGTGDRLEDVLDPRRRVVMDPIEEAGYLTEKLRGARDSRDRLERSHALSQGALNRYRTAFRVSLAVLAVGTAAALLALLG